MKDIKTFLRAVTGQAHVFGEIKVGITERLSVELRTCLRRMLIPRSWICGGEDEFIKIWQNYLSLGVETEFNAI